MKNKYYELIDVKDELPENNSWYISMNENGQTYTSKRENPDNESFRNSLLSNVITKWLKPIASLPTIDWSKFSDEEIEKDCNNLFSTFPASFKSGMMAMRDKIQQELNKK